MPVVQLETADAKRVVAALVGAGDEPVERDGHVTCGRCHVDRAGPICRRAVDDGAKAISAAARLDRRLAAVSRRSRRSAVVWGYIWRMDAITTLEEVRTFEMRRGGTRYALRDSDGREYTTFRDAIGKAAQQLRGSRVKITFHEEQRGDYQNVYVDAVEPAPAAGEGAGGDTDPREAAWRTAVEAAPWLVGEPGQTVDPEELYAKLKPFEERVQSDIEDGRADDD